jgi:glutamate/tyrosine decarboxylase-like PLP-dependent enzyme
LADVHPPVNPNNVAAEASPLTTEIEMRVGRELCDLIKYNTDPDKKPTAWGHITCDGSVANLESMWAGKKSFWFCGLVLTLGSP